MKGGVKKVNKFLFIFLFKVIFVLITNNEYRESYINIYLFSSDL